MIYKSIWMGLGALKARWKRVFNGPKIIQIDLQIPAGVNFEKYLLAGNFENASIYVQHDIVLKINWNNSIIFEISMKRQQNQWNFVTPLQKYFLKIISSQNL